jgi:hypothetical protein
MSNETREMVFCDNIHILNWLECRIAYARPNRFFHRMLRLDQCLRRTINNVVLYARPQEVDELLGPLQHHHDADCGSLCTLGELRIILDIPRITSAGARTSRVLHKNQASRTAYQLRNVDRVIVDNIFYRPENDFNASGSGREWIVLALEDDDDRLNDDRWRLVFTTFAP